MKRLPEARWDSDFIDRSEPGFSQPGYSDCSEISLADAATGKAENLSDALPPGRALQAVTNPTTLNIPSPALDTRSKFRRQRTSSQIPVIAPQQRARDLAPCLETMQSQHQSGAVGHDGNGLRYS